MAWGRRRRDHKVFGIDGRRPTPDHQWRRKSETTMSAASLPTTLAPSPRPSGSAPSRTCSGPAASGPSAPPLRGEDRRRPLSTGIGELDALLDGGFPRGQLSEIHGPASSGRTGVLLALLARTTRAGALAALVDPLDRFDPGSAAAAGIDLSRLLWLRGPRCTPEDAAERRRSPTPRRRWRRSPARASSTWWRSTSPAPTASGAACPPPPGCACSGLVEGDADGRSCSWPTATSPAAPGARRSPSSRRACAGRGRPAPRGCSPALAARARAGRHGLRTAELAFAAV